MSFTTIEQAKRQADERRKKHNPPASDQSLRDYFAAKAMQVMMTETNGEGDDNPGAPRWTPEEVADFSYDQADAMLRAREAS